MRQEKIQVDEHEIIKAFALQKTTAMTMPSASIEEMGLLEFLSFGGQQVSCALRFQLLKDLRDAISTMLETEDRTA
jgi:hypothetical protein